MSKGLVAGILAGLSALSSILGWEPVGAVLSDPGTADTVQNFVTLVLALVAGVLPGSVEKPQA